MAKRDASLPTLPPGERRDLFLAAAAMKGKTCVRSTWSTCAQSGREVFVALSVLAAPTANARGKMDRSEERRVGKGRRICYALVDEQHRTQIVVHALLTCQQENVYHDQHV